MSRKSLLPHGFKAEANRKAIKFRAELDLMPHEPLCGFTLAEHLKIKVFSPGDIFPEGTNLSKLVGTKGSNNGWSALTMSTKKGNKIIIHNDLHSLSRQQSDMMHELAHLICEHTHTNEREGINIPFFMREYNPQQEEEANYLGSVLQITREGLLWALKRNMAIEEIADFFQASTNMVTFRINSTGVRRQMSYWK